VIKRLLHFVKHTSALNAFRKLYDLYWFELRYGLKMHASAAPERVEIENPKIDGHVKYEPISHYSFQRMMKKIDWNFKQSTFIDFGCGKGAAILLASQYGFRKYIGVEYSPVLTGECKTNIEKFSKRTGRNINHDIICCDATKYEVPPEANVFYFFNPFHDEILDTILQNIEESLKTNARDILILYFNAMHKNVIEKYGYTVLSGEEKDKLNIWYSGGNYAYHKAKII
jgi:SAM-dependent methyltransferase